MATKYEYQFIQEAEPSVMVGRLQELGVERWEPVGFSVAPSGEYVVLLRREQRTKTTFGADRAHHSD